MSDPIRSISQNNYLLSNGGGGHEYYGANGVYVDNENEVIGLDTSASNAIETVIENSGAWGGAGLPISAGPGINVALENGVLMISKEEPTLLWSGTSANSFTLSEPSMHFKKLGIKLRSYYAPNYYGYCECLTNSAYFHFEFSNVTPGVATECVYGEYRYTTTDDLTYTFVNGNRLYFGRGSTGGDGSDNLTGSNLKDAGYPVEIYGIDRKST